MRVVLLHNEVGPDASLADRDLLVQLEAIAGSLRQLGHQIGHVICTLNLERARDEVLAFRPDVVFNLVESVGGSDWLVFVAAAMLDTLGVPYTGSPTTGIFLSADKLIAKQRLDAAGLPTPAWRTGDLGMRTCRRPRPPAAGAAARWIIKSATQHASFGIDHDSVIPDGPPEQILQRIAGQESLLGCPCFAEEYIEGREFNVGVVAGPGGTQCLPVAEIHFIDFPDHLPKIVGYRAKWDEDAFEYDHTVRRFEIPEQDQPLAAELSRLACQAWDLFGLEGYARVDFRVDRENRPWILELNANPCLSPDAGFAVGMERIGFDYTAMVRRLLDAALGWKAGVGT